MRSFEVADPDKVTRLEISDRQKSALGIHEGQEGHDASTLDGVGEVTLLLRRQTCETTGQNLAAFSDELLEQIHIFVIDGIAGLNR